MEITGMFKFDQDSKRYHRFQVITKEGVVGTIYVPKDFDTMPKRLVLEYEAKHETTATT